jgi:glutaredoxin
MTQTTLYRMVMPQHICPYGLKAKHLLERKGFTVDDHWLETRAQTDAFKAEHGVKTTPQTFIALFAMTALMALAASFAAYGSPFTLRAAEWFISFSMIVLALLKLQDVESFSTMFLNYDLLARRWVPYSYVYPFAEGLAGVLMTAHALPWLSIPVALFIAIIGAVSVFKAVYIDRRDIKCACVGGSSKVPLGFVSLTENLMMIAMALWMLRGAIA